MRVRDEVINELVQQWLDRAQEDFGVAQHLLKVGRYLNAVGFHSRQAAEKLLQALLVHHQIEFPKTHNIGELLDLVGPANASLAESLRGATGLSRYGAQTRYPGDLPELTIQAAALAVEQAVAVREGVYAALGEPAPPSR